MTDWFCTIAAVDRGLRVPVGSIELSIAPTVAERVLNRSPRVREASLVSFASVTMDELREVVAHDEYSADDARASLTELVEATLERDILWLLYFRKVS